MIEARTDDLNGIGDVSRDVGIDAENGAGSGD
jgi:hypothetical protein